ncbi:DUF4234 domain-containing protein [Nocardioidaceae bacterium SCSIO 66511]|nr:DUF4234 domain-containing protein [Nocardioidaceae bacterium SCSIO 66511]
MTADTPTDDPVTPQASSPPASAPSPAKHMGALSEVAPRPGKIRPTGVTILLYIVTLGFYSLYWSYAVHKEIKDYAKEGLGGPLGLVLAFFLFFVVAFTLPGEIKGLYERRGMKPPVAGTTGLWVLPGAVLIVGPIVWFVKVNGALNAFWRAEGAELPA